MVKRKQQQANVDPASFVDALSHFEETKKEFFKISWTKKEDLLNYAKIVVGGIFFSGVSLYCMDLSVKMLLSALDYVFKIVLG